MAGTVLTLMRLSAVQGWVSDRHRRASVKDFASLLTAFSRNHNEFFTFVPLFYLLSRRLIQSFKRRSIQSAREHVELILFAFLPDDTGTAGI